MVIGDEDTDVRPGHERPVRRSPVIGTLARTVAPLPGETDQA